jgi:hypothetical protein
MEWGTVYNVADTGNSTAWGLYPACTGPWKRDDGSTLQPDPGTLHQEDNPACCPSMAWTYMFYDDLGVQPVSFVYLCSQVIEELQAVIHSSYPGLQISQEQPPRVDETSAWYIYSGKGNLTALGYQVTQNKFPAISAIGTNVEGSYDLLTENTDPLLKLTFKNIDYNMSNLDPYSPGAEQAVSMLCRSLTENTWLRPSPVTCAWPSMHRRLHPFPAF